MADTAIAITAGTGTNVDTRTEGTNGNHRQVVVLGDPATNAGVAPVDATNGLAVTLTTALPAGSAAIGKLAANSGVDIGDVDVISSALPTGAATSAKQPALGTAGSASSDVLSVQGIASMTALKVDGSGVTQPVSVASVPSHAVTNAGTFAVQESGTQLVADDAAFTPGTTKVDMAGYQADETATDSVDEGDAGAARMTLDRKQIVTVQPHTTGGWDLFMASSGDGSTALTNTAQAVKASAGKVGGWYIYNPNSSATYVILYNVAQGSVTVGTTNPRMVLCIPATSAANLESVNGINFDTAIAVAATTTGGGNTAPTTALECNIWYK